MYNHLIPTQNTAIVKNAQVIKPVFENTELSDILKEIKELFLEKNAVYTGEIVSEPLVRKYLDNMVEKSVKYARSEVTSDDEILCFLNNPDLILKVKNLLSLLKFEPFETASKKIRNRRGTNQLTAKELFEVQEFRKLVNKYSFMTSDAVQTRQYFDKLICYQLKVKQLRYLLKTTFSHLNINIGTKTRKNELTRLLYSRVLKLSDFVIDTILNDYYDLCGDNTRSPYDYVQNADVPDSDSNSVPESSGADEIRNSDHSDVQDNVSGSGDSTSVTESDNVPDVSSGTGVPENNDASDVPDSDDVPESSGAGEIRNSDKPNVQFDVPDSDSNSVPEIGSGTGEIRNSAKNNDNSLPDDSFSSYDDFYSDVVSKKLSPQKEKPVNIDYSEASFFEDDINNYIITHPETTTEAQNKESLYDEIVQTPFYNRITRGSVEACKLSNFESKACKEILANKITQFEQLKDNIQNQNMVLFRLETLHSLFASIFDNLNQAIMMKTNSNLARLCKNLNSSQFVTVQDTGPVIKVYDTQIKGSIMQAVYFCNLQCHKLQIQENIIALVDGKFCNDAKLLNGYDNIYTCTYLSNDINSCSYATRPSKSCTFDHIDKNDIASVYVVNEQSAMYFPKKLKLKENRSKLAAKVDGISLQPSSKAYITFEEEGLQFFITYEDILRNFDSIIDFETSLEYIQKTWPSLNLISKVSLGLVSSIIILILMTIFKYLLAKFLTRNENNSENNAEEQVEEAIPLQILN